MNFDLLTNDQLDQLIPKHWTAIVKAAYYEFQDRTKAHRGFTYWTDFKAAGYVIYISALDPVIVVEIDGNEKPVPRNKIRSALGMKFRYFSDPACHCKLRTKLDPEFNDRRRQIALVTVKVLNALKPIKVSK